MDENEVCNYYPHFNYKWAINHLEAWISTPVIESEQSNMHSENFTDIHSLNKFTLTTWKKNSINALFPELSASLPWWDKNTYGFVKGKLKRQQNNRYTSACGALSQRIS